MQNVSHVIRTAATLFKIKSYQLHAETADKRRICETASRFLSFVTDNDEQRLDSVISAKSKT